MCRNLLILLSVALCTMQFAASPALAQAVKQSPASKAEPANKPPDAEAELERAVQEAGNDRAALVRKLEDYLHRFPDAPRKAAVYRALLDASQQLHDFPRALDYSERLIAITPDDSQMMLLAVNLLERQGDEHSLVRAVGYVFRVIDRIEKSSPDDKPARESVAEWQQNQLQVRGTLYLIRGRLEMRQKQYDAATRDFALTFGLAPNSAAALGLGEIAELEKDCMRAIPQYEAAFVLPESTFGESVDRRVVRQKLGNCWRAVHGSEAGLGEDLLAAYDRLSLAPRSAANDIPPAKNRDAKEPFAFVLRKLDGTPYALTPLKGRILVLSFWATWCGPCRELDPLFDQVAEHFSSQSDLTFLAVNTDEDESRVRPFLAQHGLNTPVVFADGLDIFLGVSSIPTVIVIDRSGRIVYRAIGFGPNDFVEALSDAITRALLPPG